MKKINTFSAQFEFISEQPYQNHRNAYHGKMSAKINSPKGIKKKILSKYRQENINSKAASGFKDFLHNKWIYQIL